MKWTGIMLILITILISCKPKEQSYIPTGKEGKGMEKFTVLEYDSTKRIQLDQLKGSKPIVVFYFSPTCPYCRAQTEEFLNNTERLSDVQLCFMTFTPLSEFRPYYDEFKFKDHPDVIAGVDDQQKFFNYFEITSVPFIAIYDKNKLLQRVINGPIKIKRLMELIQG
ncbi:thioredoxin family protein [Chitinophaga sp. Mgbs1]|uniref:Thioredoxin family protein n=1 Tax=Chitinophaga solisilvae TaxID=1233460 RepID=A0A433WJV7_9BACT|nr:thioredoxin family protein [Chitinophaga solisilvae]